MSHDFYLRWNPDRHDEKAATNHLTYGHVNSNEINIIIIGKIVNFALHEKTVNKNAKNENSRNFLRDITLCNQLKVNGRFEGTYHLH
jgi:hypothetical protein